MTTDNIFQAAPETATFAQFNAFESAVPSALKEFPTIVSDSRPTVNDGVTLYDPGQSQPFEITDEQGRVIASAPDTRDNLSEIANSCNDSDVDSGAVNGCSSCGCNEYVARGWNRNARGIQNQQYSSCDDGSCDDGDDYDPGDGGDCGPDDGGCDGGGSGLLRGLLGRFGRGGLLGRFLGGGMFGGGGMRFGRFLR